MRERNPQGSTLPDAARLPGRLLAAQRGPWPTPVRQTYGNCVQGVEALRGDRAEDPGKAGHHHSRALWEGADGKGGRKAFLLPGLLGRG